MQNLNDVDPEDRQSIINKEVECILNRAFEEAFERFDKLHTRGVDDSQVEAALNYLGYMDLADSYDEWQNDGEPLASEEEEDGAPRGIVIDPIDASSYAAIPESKDPLEREHYRAEPSTTGVDGWNVYKKRSASDNGAFIGKWTTRETTISILNTLEKAYRP